MTDYLITYNPDSEYLQHFNRNHDKKSGRFTFGDGDGDGTVNERKSKEKSTSTEPKRKAIESTKELSKFFVKNAKTNAEFTRTAKEVSELDIAKKIGAGVLGGGIGSAAILAGIGLLTENPVLFIPAAELAYVGIVGGGGITASAFIEQAKLTKIKNDFEEFDLASAPNPTVNVKKK